MVCVVIHVASHIHRIWRATTASYRFHCTTHTNVASIIGCALMDVAMYLSFAGPFKCSAPFL